MHRLLSCLAVIALLSCDRGSSDAGILAQAKTEQIIADYIRDNPQAIADAVERAKQQNIAKQIVEYADRNLLFSLGPEDAPITIIEFFDYNCGYCRKGLDWVIGQIDKGDTRVIFVETPILEERSGTSKNAALAALAAGLQNKYRAMHEALMRADSLQPDNILAMAGQLGIDVERMQQDMASDKLQTILEQSQQLAEFAQIRGTPGFFVNGTEVYGLDLEQLNQLVAREE